MLMEECRQLRSLSYRLFVIEMLRVSREFDYHYSEEEKANLYKKDVLGTFGAKLWEQIRTENKDSDVAGYQEMFLPMQHILSDHCTLIQIYFVLAEAFHLNPLAER